MAKADTVDLRPLKEFVRRELATGHPFRKAIEVLPDSEPLEDFDAQLRVLLPLARMK